MPSAQTTGSRHIFLCSFVFLLALFVTAQLSMCDAHIDADAKPPASSFLKGWSDWAQGKIGSFRKKDGETQAQHPQGAPGSWSSWASDKFGSFSGRVSKDVGKATQVGTEKVKEEGAAASKEAQDIWESSKAGVEEGSKKAQEYAGKAKDGIYDQADKVYEGGKDVGSQAAQKPKGDAEL